MIEGRDKVDVSSCTTIKPVERLRRPDADRPRPQPELQPDDGLKQRARTSPTRFSSSSTRARRHLRTRSRPASSTWRDSAASRRRSCASTRRRRASKPYFHLNSGDRTWYLTMNLTQPPFDDIHVRKAMNWIMDKAGAPPGLGRPDHRRRSRTTSSPTRCSTTSSPEYDPYKTAGRPRQRREGEAGDEGLEVRHEGRRHVQRRRLQERPADRGHPRGSTRDAASDPAGREEDRDHVHGASRSTARTRRSRRRRRTSRSPSGRAGARTTPTRSTFFSPLFDGRTIIPNGNTNYSLVGITPAQCKTLKVTGNCTNVPSVDKQIDKCSLLIGGPRTVCYENLDKTLMTKVVPWVPWLWAVANHITSTNVTKYSLGSVPHDARLVRDRGEGVVGRRRFSNRSRSPGRPRAPWRSPKLTHAALYPPAPHLDARCHQHRPVPHVPGLLQAAERRSGRCASPASRRTRTSSS